MHLTFGQNLGLDLKLSAANENYSGILKRIMTQHKVKRVSLLVCASSYNIFELVSGLALYMRILVVDISQRDIGISPN